MGSQANRGDFVSDIDAIRKRARQHIENGAVTDSYKGNRETVVRVLNDALATELVCVLRYKRHYYMASGIHSESVKNEFLEHAGEEQEHADQIAERITQLDGEPDFDPQGLVDRSHSVFFLRLLSSLTAEKILSILGLKIGLSLAGRPSDFSRGSRRRITKE